MSQESLVFDQEPVYNPKEQRALLRVVAGTEHDMEWYPTTPEMLRPVLMDILGEDFNHAIENEYTNYIHHFGLLDICAGSGSVFNIIQDLWSELKKEHPFIQNDSRLDKIITDKYAIEKSIPLIEAMPEDIAILATDFTQTTLIDKSGFSHSYMNPPYSQFEEFTVKAIRELRCQNLYLTIPKRWENSQLIQDALKARKAEAVVLGDFDFKNAEVRQARAKVQVIRVALGKPTGYSYHDNDYSMKVDPFEQWLNEEFPILKVDMDSLDTEVVKDKTALQERVRSEIVKGGNLIETLEQMYLKEMAQLMANYKAINELDYTLLKEMNVDTGNLRKSIKSRISGLKTLFWVELFSNYGKITKRLTSDKRKHMLDTLARRTNIDFTVQNALAVTIFVLKAAGKDVDQQLLDVYGRMVSDVNIENYKSNQRVFSKGEWGWNRSPENLTHFKLSYRMVLDRQGGISVSAYSWENERNRGLSNSASNFIGDLLVIARNLGFDSLQQPMDFYWESGKKVRFTYLDSKMKEQLIFEVKAYKKGSLHLRLGEDFGIALNIEHGRLKSWVHSSSQASEEMGIKPEKAQQFFNCQYDLKQIKASQVLSIGA